MLVFVQIINLKIDDKFMISETIKLLLKNQPRHEQTFAWNRFIIFPSFIIDFSYPIFPLFCQIPLSLLNISKSSRRFSVSSALESLFKLGHVIHLSKQICHKNLTISNYFSNYFLFYSKGFLFLYFGLLVLLTDFLGDQISTKGYVTISGELFVCIRLTILNGFLVNLGVVLAKSICLTKYPVRMYCSDCDSFLYMACLLSNSQMISRTQLRSEDFLWFQNFLYL